MKCVCMEGGGGYSVWVGGGLKCVQGITLSLCPLCGCHVCMLDLQTRNVEMGCHTILY